MSSVRGPIGPHARAWRNVVGGLLALTIVLSGSTGVWADPEDPTTTSSSTTTSIATTTTTAPSTTTSTARQTTTTARVTTTTRPVTTTTVATTTTTEETTTTTRRTTTTGDTGTTIEPAVITPTSTQSTDDKSGSGDGGGMSSGSKVTMIVAGLGIVGVSIAALTVAYWRHTRPVPYMDALDALGHSTPVDVAPPSWTAVVESIAPTETPTTKDPEKPARVGDPPDLDSLLLGEESTLREPRDIQKSKVDEHLFGADRDSLEIVTVEDLAVEAFSTDQGGADKIEAEEIEAEEIDSRLKEMFETQDGAAGTEKSWGDADDMIIPLWGDSKGSAGVSDIDDSKGSDRDKDR